MTTNRIFKETLNNCSAEQLMIALKADAKKAKSEQQIINVVDDYAWLSTNNLEKASAMLGWIKEQRANTERLSNLYKIAEARMTTAILELKDYE